MIVGIMAITNGTISGGNDKKRGMARLSSGVRMRNICRECRSIRVVFM
jgi:hypothetical protein